MRGVVKACARMSGKKRTGNSFVCRKTRCQGRKKDRKEYREERAEERVFGFERERL